MLDAQNGGKMISEIPQVGKLTHSQQQHDNYIIDKPTHVTNNCSSYIDLIFCNNQSILTKYGVDMEMPPQYHNW